MSEMTIHLKLQPWLRQWLVHEQGGEPVSFQRNSTEHDIIKLSLVKLPEGCKPDLPGEDTVAIRLPSFKKIDVRVYNHMTRHGKTMLRNCIRSRMIVAMWNDISAWGNIGKQKQDVIWTWMEANGIELTETNFFALQKIYQRRRAAYIKKKYRENRNDFGGKK